MGTELSVGAVTKGTIRNSAEALARAMAEIRYVMRHYYNQPAPTEALGLAWDRVASLCPMQENHGDLIRRVQRELHKHGPHPSDDCHFCRLMRDFLAAFAVEDTK